MKNIAGMFVLFAMGTMGSCSVMAGDMKDYSITITNATSHHVITPPLIVIHNRDFKLFEVTGIASEGLAKLAETGGNTDLSNEVYGAEGVIDVIAGTEAIVYGNKRTYEFSAPKKAVVSFVGMLATTNDAFAGVSSVSLPKRSVTYMAATYDAGSEVNNENCAYIPGPPCASESGNLRATEGAEGFITIHNGIQGGSDLNQAHLDWRGATAIVTINRIDD